jgi:DNA-binding NarL/FixJ family response regulator
MDKKIRIIITEQQEIMLEGLKSVFKHDKNFELIGHTTNGMNLLELLRDHTPDIVLLDAELKKLKTKAILKRLSARYPEIKVIIFTVETDNNLINEYIVLGAKGIVSKESELEELLKTIFKVHENHFSENEFDAVSPALKQTSLTESLTNSELKVMLELCSGISEAEVARKLYISPFTVHTHRRNIYRKLRVHSQFQLNEYAKKAGLIQ